MTSPAETHTGASGAGARLEPAQYVHRFVDAGGVKLHYLDYGNEGKPPMLCVHGGAANGHWFDFVAPGLIDDYHVISIDLRGHGDSSPVEPPSYRYEDYAADLDKAVAALDLRDFVLMGHSMGGTVSLLYSAKYPGRVKTLVLIDSTVNLSEERIGRLRSIGSGPGKRYETKEALVERYRLRPGESVASPEVVRHIASHSCKQDEDGTWRHKFDRAVYATREIFDGTPLWADIKIPALLVKADRSDRISPEVYMEVTARCPQAELEVVPESDHHATLDNPQGFLAAVKPFLARNR